MTINIFLAVIIYRKFECLMLFEVKVQKVTKSWQWRRKSSKLQL